MKKKYQQVLNWFKTHIKKVTPGKTAERGAALGLLTASIFFWILFGILFFFQYWRPLGTTLQYCIAFSSHFIGLFGALGY